jgi:hypothetical protein
MEAVARPDFRFGVGGGQRGIWVQVSMSGCKRC